MLCSGGTPKHFMERMRGENKPRFLEHTVLSSGTNYCLLNAGDSSTPLFKQFIILSNQTQHDIRLDLFNKTAVATMIYTHVLKTVMGVKSPLDNLNI